MSIEIRTWLYDILNAIEEIYSFFEGGPFDFSLYKGDLKTRRAVERNIEIIGGDEPHFEYAGIHCAIQFEENSRYKKQDHSWL